MKKTSALALSAAPALAATFYLTYRVQHLTAQITTDPVLEGRSMGAARTVDFFSGYSPGMVMLYAGAFIIGTWMLFFLFTRLE